VPTERAEPGPLARVVNVVAPSPGGDQPGTRIEDHAALVAVVPPHRLRARERAARVVELRMQGHSMAAIGGEVGVSKARVHAILTAHLAETAEAIRERAEELRALEAEKLEVAAGALWQRVLEGELGAHAAGCEIDTAMRICSAWIGADTSPARSSTSPSWTPTAAGRRGHRRRGRRTSRPRARRATHRLTGSAGPLLRGEHHPAHRLCGPPGRPGGLDPVGVQVGGDGQVRPLGRKPSPSRRAIARELTARGIPTAQGATTWHEPQVARAMRALHVH
jgi:hypothetical protein